MGWQLQLVVDSHDDKRRAEVAQRSVPLAVAMDAMDKATKWGGQMRPR